MQNVTVGTAVTGEDFYGNKVTGEVASYEYFNGECRISVVNAIAY